MVGEGECEVVDSYLEHYFAIYARFVTSEAVSLVGGYNYSVLGLFVCNNTNGLGYPVYIFRFYVYLLSEA